MVTLVREMKHVRSTLATLADQIGLSKPPPLGAMIETPAAALCSDALVAYSDFLSIGTNDLTQYTLAAGRENPLVSDYFAEDHPAVLKLLRLVVAQSQDLPVSLCGEVASNPESLEQVLQTGVRSLSVPPPLVPTVKEAVRCLELRKLEQAQNFFPQIC
jgi:phosphoenolpyruvate-protein kinase (PTS system EI component)